MRAPVAEIRVGDREHAAREQPLAGGPHQQEGDALAAGGEEVVPEAAPQVPGDGERDRHQFVSRSRRPTAITKVSSESSPGLHPSMWKENCAQDSPSTLRPSV